MARASVDPPRTSAPRRLSARGIAAFTLLVLALVAALVAPFLVDRGPAPVADVPLTDQDGHTVRWSDFRGQHLIVYFGYTGCPDVCPTGLSELAKGLRALGPDARKVQVLFVSLDPGADTPERLKRYMAYFDPTFRGLVPAPERLAEVTHEFDVAFQRTRVKGGTRIEHSTACYVLGPGGTLDGAFDTPISPAALRRRLGL